MPFIALFVALIALGFLFPTELQVHVLILFISAVLGERLTLTD